MPGAITAGPFTVPGGRERSRDRRYTGPVNYSLLSGVVAALLAALAWSLNFIVPFVVGRYTIFDLALVRFLISGLVAIAYLMFRWKDFRALTAADWRVSFGLGLVGYFIYFQALAAAALYAGPVIAPAFLALVPVVLAVVGNLRQPTLAWRHLQGPIALATVGLLLVNAGGLDRASIRQAPSLVLGVPLAILAAACWVWFGLLNQSALAKRPTMPAGVWTALIMIGASLGMVLFIPIGVLLKVFAADRLGLGWGAASALYIWGTVLALTASVGGALAWTFASQRLPVALSAQLITMESVFGTVLGLMVRHRWPTLLEAVGMTVLLAGVAITIHLFQGRGKDVAA
jgi:drug/metabolite transporter (DMT)-like permease